MGLNAASWNTFAQVLGAVSGALTGLLFVAVSLNIERLNRWPALRISAGQTLVLFVTGLLVAILLSVPGQGAGLLGGELIALAVLVGLVQLALGRGKKTVDPVDAGEKLLRMPDRMVPSLLTCGLLIIAGATLLAGWGGGLYWLVPAMILALTSGVVSAWLFLTRLSQR